MRRGRSSSRGTRARPRGSGTCWRPAAKRASRFARSTVPSSTGSRPSIGGSSPIAGSPRAIGERELAAFPFGPDDLVVVLDGITDPQNLGAAARSAEAAGATMLVTRTRRAADVTPAAIRASAGALMHLTHARIANIARGLERLKDAGFTVVGLDEHADRTVYEAEPPEGRVAVVLGSEGEGLGRLTRAACDLLVRLPMRGRVGSLNASASLSAALYAFVLPRRLGGS